MQNAWVFARQKDALGHPQRHPPSLPDWDPSEARAPISQTTWLAPVAGRPHSSIPSCGTSRFLLSTSSPPQEHGLSGLGQALGGTVPGSTVHQIRTHHCIHSGPRPALCSVQHRALQRSSGLSTLWATQATLCHSHRACASPFPSSFFPSAFAEAQPKSQGQPAT